MLSFLHPNYFTLDPTPPYVPWKLGTDIFEERLAALYAAVAHRRKDVLLYNTRLMWQTVSCAQKRTKRTKGH